MKFSQRFGLWLAFFGILTASTAAFSKSPNQPQTDQFMSQALPKQPVVVLLPHQDDEMFMAGTIKKYLEEGRPVYTVMVTDGSKSHVRSVLNARNNTRVPTYCFYHACRHHPRTEGYDALTERTFTAARNREFFDSVSRLGVPSDHILFANAGGIEGSSEPLYRDAKLTKDQAAKVIAYFYGLYGDGTYLAVGSRVGESVYLNRDHLAIHEALADAPGISEKKIFVDKEYPGQLIILAPSHRAAKSYALDAYYEWNPRAGRFAVGAHSVKHMLDTWKQRAEEYVIDLPGSVDNVAIK